jgi:hypothetical protein
VSSTGFSLPDDRGLFAELEALDALSPQSSLLSDPLFEADIEDLDRGLASSRSPGVRPAAAFTTFDMQVAAVDALAPEPANARLARQLPAVVTWLVAMSLGMRQGAQRVRACVTERIGGWSS